MKNFTRTILAAAVIGAVAFGGLTAVQSASADPLTDATVTPTVTVAPLAGKVDGSHNTFGTMLTSIATNVGCPVGYRGTSGTFLFQGNVNKGSIANARTASTAYGFTGLDGHAILEDNSSTIPNNNPFVANKAWPTVGVIAPGAFELRLYCFASTTSVDYINDKWISLPMTLSADSLSWSVDVPAAPKVTPTVSLTASANADNTVVLTGTVKKTDGTVATNAAGNVVFTTTTGVAVGSAAVAAGVATVTTPVQAAGAYGYLAKFVGASDVVYNDSVNSAPSTVNINGTNLANTTVSVVIPGVGGLSLTGVSTAVSLGTAALDTATNTLKASGSLGSSVVTDTRNLGSADWNLTGQVGDFTAGTKTIDGKALGWVPALVGTNNAGTAGAAVAAAVGTGLKTPSILSKGAVVDGKLTTTTGAALNFQVPANTAVGAYAATLTLTLI